MQHAALTFTTAASSSPEGSFLDRGGPRPSPARSAAFFGPFLHPRAYDADRRAPFTSPNPLARSSAPASQQEVPAAAFLPREKPIVKRRTIGHRSHHYFPPSNLRRAASITADKPFYSSPPWLPPPSSLRLLFHLLLYCFSSGESAPSLPDYSVTRWIRIRKQKKGGA